MVLRQVQDGKKRHLVTSSKLSQFEITDTSFFVLQSGIKEFERERHLPESDGLTKDVS